LEPNSMADGYIDDRGMSCIPKIRSPSPMRPLALCWGFFRPRQLWCVLATRVKMKTSMPLPKYTAEQITEIIERITTLRMRWLRQVENQLASRPSRRVIDDYPLGGEPAE
jgi:hypothetical protein